MDGLWHVVLTTCHGATRALDLAPSFRSFTRSHVPSSVRSFAVVSRRVLGEVPSLVRVPRLVQKDREGSFPFLSVPFHFSFRKGDPVPSHEEETDP